MTFYVFGCLLFYINNVIAGRLAQPLSADVHHPAGYKRHIHGPGRQLHTAPAARYKYETLSAYWTHCHGHQGVEKGVFVTLTRMSVLLDHIFSRDLVCLCLSLLSFTVVTN